jgi:hypothetical protein
MKGFSTLLYASALGINYHWISRGYFDHLGINYYAPSTGTVAATVVVLLLFSLTLPSELRRPSDFVVHTLFMLLICPVALLVVTGEASPSSSGYAGLLLLLFGLFLVVLVSRLPVLRVRGFRTSDGIVLIVLIAIWLAFHGFLFLHFGFSLPTSVLDVYEVRLQSREVLAAGPAGLGYIMRWSANAINPCIFLLGLVTKRWYLVLLGVAGQVSIYTFDATKVTLFSLIFVLGAWYVVSQGRRAITYMYGIATVILLLLPALDSWFDLGVLNFLVNRRVFFMPSVAAVLYFDVFSTSDSYYWSTSFLAGLVESPTDYSSPAFHVGSTVFGSSAVSANANFLSAGFANAGSLGVLFVSVSAGLFLWFYNSVTTRADLIIALPLLAVPAFALANSALPSVLFTHGFLACLVLGYFVASIRSGQKTSPPVP